MEASIPSDDACSLETVWGVEALRFQDMFSKRTTFLIHLLAIAFQCTKVKASDFKYDLYSITKVHRAKTKWEEVGRTQMMKPF